MQRIRTIFLPAVLVAAVFVLLAGGVVIIRATSRRASVSANTNRVAAPSPSIATQTTAPRVVSLNPPFTSLTPASREQMDGWLKERFASEWKDITIHRSLELGEPESTPDGYSIVTFKYVGSFSWKKGYFVSHRRYTFTANGDYVRSEIVIPAIEANELSDLLPS